MCNIPCRKHRLIKICSVNKKYLYILNLFTNNTNEKLLVTHPILEQDTRTTYITSVYGPKLMRYDFFK